MTPASPLDPPTRAKAGRTTSDHAEARAKATRFTSTTAWIPSTRSAVARTTGESGYSPNDRGHPLDKVVCP